jgi:hypothetical protein
MKMRDVTHPVLFHHWQDGVQTHFASGMMETDERILAIEPVLIPVTMEDAQMMIRERGVETHRLARLLPTPVMQYPPILVAFLPQDQSHLIVDGAHRYCAAAQKKAEHILGRIIPRRIWKHFVIEDFPDVDQSIKDTFSGIL